MDDYCGTFCNNCWTIQLNVTTTSLRGNAAKRASSKLSIQLVWPNSGASKRIIYRWTMTKCHVLFATIIVSTFYAKFKENATAISKWCFLYCSCCRNHRSYRPMFAVLPISARRTLSESDNDRVFNFCSFVCLFSSFPPIDSFATQPNWNRSKTFHFYVHNHHHHKHHPIKCQTKWSTHQFHWIAMEAPLPSN